MWDVLLDAFLDTLKLSWVLLIFYILIEFVDQKIAVKMRDKLKSRYSVAVGAGFGIVPQCGFSVLASDLYSKSQITLGALLAVFIATSDEALPILFSSINQDGVWLKLLTLILSKFVLALIAGYATDFIIKLAKRKKKEAQDNTDKERIDENHVQSQTTASGLARVGDEMSRDKIDDNESQTLTARVSQNSHCEEEEHEHGEHSHVEDEEETEEAIDIHKGCCGHHIDDAKESNVKKYLLHPLLHTLKILAYILLVNIVMGILVYYVGEERIAAFMAKSGGLQPLLVTLVGLIPNCASSVIITQLFLADTISFGSCLGGLIVNAGLGIAYLFKANKNVKQNLAITAGLFVFALSVAIVFHYALAGLI